MIHEKHRGLLATLGWLPSRLTALKDLRADILFLHYYAISLKKNSSNLEYVVVVYLWKISNKMYSYDH